MIMKILVTTLLLFCFIGRLDTVVRPTYISDCKINDKTRQDGAIWFRDPFIRCSCSSGKVICITMECSQPPKGYQAAEKQIGVICPAIVCSAEKTECQSTTETWVEEDKCITCICENNQTVCTPMMCPMKITDYNNSKYVCESLIRKKDSCCHDIECPVCTLPNGLIIAHGETKRVDHCTNCTCNDNFKIVCTAEACPSPPKGCKFTSLIEGQCCQTFECPEVTRLYLATLNSLHLYELDIKQLTKDISYINETVFALSYVASEERFFWLTNEAVYTININGIGQKLLELNVSPKGGLTVDWIRQKLYWTENSSILSYDLNSSEKSQLVSGLDGNSHTDVKVDPYNSKLFWVSKNVLMQSISNGQDQRELFLITSQKNKNSGITNCNCTKQFVIESSLAMDHTDPSDPQLYFFAVVVETDIYTEIWKSDVIGCLCSRIVRNPKCINPRSMTVDKQYLYWVGEKGSKNILFKVHKNSGTIQDTFELEVEHMLAYGEYLQPLPPAAPEFCEYNNIFSCDGGTCIPLSWKCNNYKDCIDGSDEKDCCGEKQFSCTNKNCIHKNRVCDNINDCTDGSDENCGPTDKNRCKDKFYCPNGRCIPNNWICDNQEDCNDGSDERNCTAPRCKDSEFSCDKKCIDIFWKCNGYEECVDHSDENDCDILVQFGEKDNTQKICYTSGHCFLSTNLSLENPTSIVFNSTSKTVFWTDMNRGTIKMATFFNDTIITILQDLEAPYGLDIDWTTNKLYWTSLSENNMYVTQLNDTNRIIEVIISFRKFKDIVIYSSKNTIYWLEYSIPTPKIMRADMNGKNIKSIVDIPGKPSGLKIDFKTDKLMWIVNSHNSSRILSHPIASTAIRPLIEVNYRENQITAFALSSTHIYWSEANTNTTFQIERNNSNTTTSDHI